MKLFFVLGSKQQKFLIETDYVEDIVDVMISFFEDHGKFPHMLHLEHELNNLKIYLNSGSEYFLINEIDQDILMEMQEYIDRYNG